MLFSNSKVWLNAANQVLFQMSLGAGVLISAGSFHRREEGLIKTSLAIPALTFFCGVLASLVVFSYMGYMSHATGIPIDEIPLKGPELVFIAYPAALTLMPLSNLWSILFFLIMVLLGIDTQFGFIDTIASSLEDEFMGGSEDGKLHYINLMGF
jgi:SNF family Na+-dependent transporter